MDDDIPWQRGRPQNLRSELPIRWAPEAPDWHEMHTLPIVRLEQDGYVNQEDPPTLLNGDQCFPPPDPGTLICVPCTEEVAKEARQDGTQ